ncbi:MAG: excinuclease ABC subunit UvrC [Chloroflexi bacterium]|uniref:UvrABC system protein C n=1 Tax=Candidatus Chlorohelix allophototropha TaxID=3003348 RepID=A0A8T7LW51_9CHLR|nr:excinuclease ABC subunit UvrC [Chloroflexota bacterium]WJW66314.1 excinuclease ABC subunit UvrC [Chloroflexota bacterium L227-S17]
MSRETYLDEKVKSLPHKPGVYIMRDEGNNIIYVGKAISLRNRVSSYFGSLNGQTPKVEEMVRRIHDFEYIVVDTEREALNLENTLIKLHRPKYNILLKDDKTYPYIKVTVNEDWARTIIVRKVLDDGARYFGPFAGNGSAYRTVQVLQKLFPYRNCDLTINGKEDRPCLDYFIHRCLGPCAGFADKAEYNGAINQVIMFLEGKSDEVVQQLEAKMEAAAEELHFERAARFRDQLISVRQVTEQQKVVSNHTYDEDVIAIALDEGEAAVQIFFIRRGKLVGREHFFMKGTQDETPSEILTSFITQYYSEATYIPTRMLLQNIPSDLEVVKEWLSARAGSSVELLVPDSGDKQALVQMVAQNATEALQQNRLKWLNDEQKTTFALNELQKALGLSARPRRIECYDISNTQGTNSVASMVVFEDGSPKKSDYRKFKIKTVEGANDYASMQEVLSRRFKRAKTVDEMNEMASEEEKAALAQLDVINGALELTGQEAGLEVQDPHDANWGVRGHPGKEAKKGKKSKPELKAKSKVDYSWQILPDLVIIDGGKGQLSAAVAVMKELEMEDIPVVGLAKQHDEIFQPGKPLSVYLPRNSESLYLVQRIRDEAHRFAITFHRQVRSKEAYKSTLDEVPGIGPRRKQALLKAFGTAAKIKNASDEELLALEGMNKAALAKLREYL